MGRAPTWARASGIVMIILTSLGIFGHIIVMVIPALFDMQMEVMDGISRIDDFRDTPFREGSDIIRNVFTVSQGTRTFIYAFGFIGFGISVIGIIGGVRLLQPKLSSVIFARNALIISLAYRFIFFVFFFVFSEGMAIALIYPLIFSCLALVADIALVLIVSMSDRSSYGAGGQPQASFEDMTID